MHGLGARGALNTLPRPPPRIRFLHSLTTGQQRAPSGRYSNPSLNPDPLLRDPPILHGLQVKAMLDSEIRKEKPAEVLCRPLLKGSGGLVNMATTTETVITNVVILGISLRTRSPGPSKKHTWIDSHNSS